MPKLFQETAAERWVTLLYLFQMCHLFDKCWQRCWEKSQWEQVRVHMDIAKTDINLKIVQIVPFNPSSNFLLRTEVTIVNPKVGAGDRGGLLACHGHSQELEVTR